MDTDDPQADADASAEGRRASAARRDALAGLRDASASIRDDAGAAADARAQGRAHAAQQRDASAVAREREGEDGVGRGRRGDRAAEKRDAASAARDSAAARADENLILAHGPVPMSVVMGVVHRAQHSRAAASSDRRASAEDRRAASEERARAAALHRAAVEDRAAAAADRAAAQEDVLTSSGRRDRSREDRRAAAEDRRMAAQDRDESVHALGAAAIDSLTGARLRGPGLLDLEREVARCARTTEPLAIVYLDVDQLKAVNDTSGHVAGDDLLRAVAHAIRAGSRPYDLLVRVGGDEFVCALPGMTAEAAAVRMAAVNVELRQGLTHGSVSVGIAAARTGDTLEALLLRADGALYHQRSKHLHVP